jgi:hypothetical protein
MTTPNMTSVRLTILNAMVATFQNMDATLPTDDPYGITWDTVGLGPLVDFDNRKRYSLGIVPGPEREEFSMPYIMSFMTVNVEFRVTVNQTDQLGTNVTPGTMSEQALTVIKRAMTADRTWGGIAIDTKATASEIDLVSYADRSAMGVLTVVVQFRYSHLDPRDPDPDY